MVCEYLTNDVFTIWNSEMFGKFEYSAGKPWIMIFMSMSLDVTKEPMD